MKYLLLEKEVNCIENDFSVNPANGLPMLVGGVVDVAGNQYGLSDMSVNVVENEDLFITNFCEEF
ncbi:hypothetical protein [Vreelandella sedimenti]|uniref:hypothetical protein n=1 Tax=Vreelandella sedimenti TaxID=2729618 RepID=UPI00257EA27E|nr:hypothetical protein [Halomonas sp. UBA3173]|tara:strand:- start:18654 stop:18848 length:195 start_codon:yes stop_codon:yes gene_type:complete